MNSWTGLGRLTKDPDLRYFEQSGTVWARFTIAVDKPLSREKQMEYEQQGRPTADFINCVAWGGRAETIAQYVKKGEQLAVTGRIETGSYQDETGKMVYTTDVNVNSFDLISGNRQQGATESSGGFQGSQSAQQNPLEGYGAVTSDGPYGDDDIPF